MNDLPPPRRLPELRPAHGQVEEALRLVRERRRRGLVRAAASSAGAAVVAALLVTLRGPDASVLDQTDQGVTQTATAVPSPTGHGRETDSATGPRLATPGPGEASPPRRPGPSATVAPSAGVATPSPTARVRPRPPVVRERFSALSPEYVADGTSGRCAGGGGSCHVPGSRTREDDVLLLATVCAGGNKTVELRFPTEQELDAIVRTEPDRREVWRWSLGFRFADEPHVIALAPSECVRWSVPWDYRDEAGTRVPKGRYLVVLPVMSDPGIDMSVYVDVP